MSANDASDTEQRISQMDTIKVTPKLEKWGGPHPSQPERALADNQTQ